jgi:hypothetical protein
VADLELSLLANTREAQKEFGTDVPASLDKMSDALDDVVRDGERGGEKLERSFREVADAAKKESREVGEAFDKNATRGFDRAGDAAREFKGEAIQNLGEVASSFDGTVTGIADGFQGLAGGASVALINMGGGLAIAGAGLAGLGLVGGAVLSGIAAKGEAMRESLSTSFQQMVDDGVAAFDELRYQDRLAEAFDPGGDVQAKVQATADALGLPFHVAAEAYAGNQEAIEKFKTAYSAALDDIESDSNRVDTAQQQVLDNAVKGIADQIDAVEQARDAYARYNDSLLTSTGITEAGHQARELADRLDSIPSSTNAKVTVEADTSALERDLAKSRVVRVNLEGYTRSGQRVV